MALSRSSIGKLAVSGYPGHIFVCKLRYGYGHQEYIEKLEILHSWFSDLNAYLPVIFKGKEKEYNEDKPYSIQNKDGNIIKLSLSDLMSMVRLDIDVTYEKYQPAFEGQSLDGTERLFIKSLRSIKEQLDVITAESKIIEGIKADDGQELMAG
jgi:hypothetical protein